MEISLKNKKTERLDKIIAENSDLSREKISNLSDHFKRNKNDKHSTRGLLFAVNQRKRLLEYLKKQNPESYKNILTKLNLRK